MTTYMIDFENVKSKGLTGIDLLGKDDKVIILYSENSDTISFDMHKKVLESTSDIEYLKVKVGGKNALDFQLSTLLGYLVAKGDNSHIFIISNDKGFDKLHDFWNVNYKSDSDCIVYRTQTISKAVQMKADSVNKEKSETIDIQKKTSDMQPKNEVVEEAQINDTPVEIKKTPARRGRRPQKNLSELISEILGDIPQNEDIPQIKECLSTADTKEDFHNSLAKIFKHQATDFYKLLRPKYARLKNLSNRENDVRTAPVKNESKSAKVTDAKTLSEELSNLLGSICNPDDIDNIEKCIKNTQTKQALYISMLKIYKRERGCEIYKILKPEYSNLVALKED